MTRLMIWISSARLRHLSTDAMRRPNPWPKRSTRIPKPGVCGAQGQLPIFQIGGRMDRDDLPALEDEEVHARRHARMETFLDGISRLKDGVERRLPLLRACLRQAWVFGGLGVLMIVLMAYGITLLFKLTGADVRTDPAGRFERAARRRCMWIEQARTGSFCMTSSGVRPSSSCGKTIH